MRIASGDFGKTPVRCLGSWRCERCGAACAPDVRATGHAVRQGPLTPLEHALAALDQHGSQVAFRYVLGMVGFTVPSRLPRFHVVNFIGGAMSTYLVADGRGSDPENSGWVELLSNKPGSNASCAGSVVAGDVCLGKYGRSRRLHDLDPDNNLAAPRGIVVHAADYGTKSARASRAASVVVKGVLHCPATT